MADTTTFADRFRARMLKDYGMAHTHGAFAYACITYIDARDADRHLAELLPPECPLNYNATLNAMQTRSIPLRRPALAAIASRLETPKQGYHVLRSYVLRLHLRLRAQHPALSGNSVFRNAIRDCLVLAFPNAVIPRDEPLFLYIALECGMPSYLHHALDGDEDGTVADSIAANSLWGLDDHAVCFLFHRVGREKLKSFGHLNDYFIRDEVIDRLVYELSADRLALIVAHASDSRWVDAAREARARRATVKHAACEGLAGIADLAEICASYVMVTDLDPNRAKKRSATPHY